MQIKGYNFGFGTLIYSHVPYLITFFKIISILPMFNPKFFIITARKPRSLSGGLCPGQEGLCPGVSVQEVGVSVQGGVSVQWGSLSLSRGGSLSRGVCQGDPPYSKERAVRILLECILVLLCTPLDS